MAEVTGPGSKFAALGTADRARASRFLELVRLAKYFPGAVPLLPAPG